MAMKTRVHTVVLTLLALALIGPTRARAGQTSAGSIELTPTISFSHSNLKREGYGDVDTSTQLDVTPGVGVCLTDHWEVTGAALVRYLDSNGSSDTGLGMRAGVLYNFDRRGSVIPFAGAGFGVLFNSGFTFDDTAVLFPDLTAGVRLPVGSAASVNLSLGYQHESDGHVKVNRVVSQIGVSLFPWRAR
jgi:hypothetical protein